jgi:hypothetical protein
MTAGESSRAKKSLMRMRIHWSIMYPRISDADTQRTSLDSHYEPLIKANAAAPAEAWDLDADSYTADTWLLVRQLDQKIRAAFRHRKGVTTPVATKVLLGVFGNVPAFDTYSRAGFHAATFGPKAFGRLGRSYAEHTDTIERHRIPTLDFHTGSRRCASTAAPRLSTSSSLSKGSAAV